MFKSILFNVIGLLVLIAGFFKKDSVVVLPNCPNALGQLTIRKLQQLGFAPVWRNSSNGIEIFFNYKKWETEHLYQVLEASQFFVEEVLGEELTFVYDYNAELVSIYIGHCVSLEDEVDVRNGQSDPIRFAAEALLYRTIPSYLNPIEAARENVFMLAH